MVNADRRLAKTNATDDNNNNNTKNTVKVKVKKNKVKTKSKSNAQRGIDNTKQDINNKKYKVRKRVKRNTDLTPKVAKNTKADAGKYSALPNYAYRPADSPTHILKSKNDQVQALNKFLNQTTEQNFATEEEISKIRHETELAKKRTNILTNLRRKEITARNKALHEEEKAKLDIDEYEREQNLKALEEKTKMKREAIKRKHQLDVDAEVRRLNAEEQDAKEKAEYDKKLLTTQENVAANKKKIEHKKQLYETQLQKYKLLGSYKQNADGTTMVDEHGNPVFRRGAKQFADKGLIFEKGELQLQDEKSKLAIQEEIHKQLRERAKFEEEYQKTHNRITMLNDPVYKKMLDDHKAQLDTLHQLELAEQMQQRRAPLQEKINATQQQINKYKLQGISNPELEAELKQLESELSIVTKNNEDIVAKKIKLERIKEEQLAQSGEVEKLNQLLKEHTDKSRELQRQIDSGNKAIHIAQDRQKQYYDTVSKLQRQYQAYTEQAAADREKLLPYLPEQGWGYPSDPTEMYSQLLAKGNELLERRDRYLQRASEIGRTVYDLTAHNDKLAKVGYVIQDVNNKLVETGLRLRNSEIPDIEQIDIDVPTGEELENRLEEFMSNYEN